MPDTLVQRIKKPAPRWFRITKKCVSLGSNAAIVILLAMGFADNSVLILWCKVGLSTLMEILEAALTEPDEAPNE